MPMTDTTRELASLPAQAAIPRLLDSYGARLYSVAVRLCRDSDAAEDLVQETFFNAFRHWDQFEGRSSPATWLYTIAARACRRMQRKRAGEPQAVASLSELMPSGEPGVPDLPAPDDGPLDETLRQEARDAVERAIATLPSTFRLPLVLKELADFSVAEVAEILDIKQATVKTRVHRGRLLLRKALAERLPSRAAPPPDHAKRVCLDLLHAKQNALDRGVTFPLPPGELCARCEALFSTLDLAHDVCVDLGRGELPEALRAELLREFGASPSPGGRAVS